MLTNHNYSNSVEQNVIAGGNDILILLILYLFLTISRKTQSSPYSVL